MKLLPVLFLTLVSTSVWSSELRIDPALLQEHVRQRTEQAAQQGGAPSAPSTWMSEPTIPSEGYGMGADSKSGQGYGRGFENRYGQGATSMGASSGASMGSAGQGATHGMGGGGRGRH